MAHNSIVHGRSGAVGSDNTTGHIRLIVDKLDFFSCNGGMWQAGVFWPSRSGFPSYSKNIVRQQAKTDIPE